jgi:hypothetical protein
MLKRHLFTVAAFLLIVPLIFTQAEVTSATVKIPETVKDISRQNTYPNPDMDPEYVQPSASTLELFKTTNYQIENPNLIRMLNETTINPSGLSFGFRANIYLGNWALNYESKETSVNWEYKEANVNKFDNRGGNTTSELTYEQKEEFTAYGGLTTPVIAEDEVKKLMIADAKAKTGLNLAFHSTIGRGTKQETIMRVPPNKMGFLHAFVPAASERGNVMYGQVYLNLKGTEKKLVIKNVTYKGVGAWIPVQDKITFKYVLK